jgi:acyl homoserine lactone synthase
MAQISMGHGSDACMTEQRLDGMFKLRHIIFKERLGWDVLSDEGREKDYFDDLDPIYMVSQSHREAVDGCWRLLPTTGPYMLKDTFPELLRGAAAPEHRDTWELSRFAVAPTSAEDQRQVNFRPVTFDMMREVVSYGMTCGIKQYVSVTSVALERMLRRVGIPMRRFGDGKAVRIGRVLSVAVWIDVNEACLQAVSPQTGAVDEERRVA